MPTYHVSALRRQTLRSAADFEIDADDLPQAAAKANAIPDDDLRWSNFDADSGPSTYLWSVAEVGSAVSIDFQTDENGELHDC